MKLFHTLLCITCSISLCFAMQNQPQEQNNCAQKLDLLFLKKRLQLQQAVRKGGKAAITELRLNLDHKDALAFSPRTQKALLKAELIDEQGKIADSECLKLIYADEFLMAEIQGISRK